jgi:hypothetical protein
MSEVGASTFFALARSRARSQKSAGARGKNQRGKAKVLSVKEEKREFALFSSLSRITPEARFQSP